VRLQVFSHSSKPVFHSNDAERSFSAASVLCDTSLKPLKSKLCKAREKPAAECTKGYMSKPVFHCNDAERSFSAASV
jgi:ribosomal protein S20